MLPSDFEYDLKQINPDLFLGFNNKFKKWQIRTNRNFTVKIGKVEIEPGKKVLLHQNVTRSVVIRTFENNSEMDRETLTQIAKDEYYNRNIGGLEYTKQNLSKNDELDLKKEKEQTEQTHYALKTNEDFILNKPRVFIKNNPLVGA